MLDPTPGYSHYSIAQHTKRYNATELCNLAEEFEENYPVNPAILSLLKFHNLSLTEPKSTDTVANDSRTSEEDGMRLDYYNKYDRVFRNYNGRYEEYEIVCTRKDIWKLKDTSGQITEWNAANNGGFMLVNQALTSNPMTATTSEPQPTSEPVATEPVASEPPTTEPTNIIPFTQTKVNPLAKLLSSTTVTRFLKTQS